MFLSLLYSKGDISNRTYTLPLHYTVSSGHILVLGFVMKERNFYTVYNNEHSRGKQSQFKCITK